MDNEPTGPWLLAIDTSSEWAGLALTDGSSAAELNWAAGRRQTASVMVEVERLLGTMRLGMNDIGAVAVATGPGSFSGLRVGMGIAKGLAIATGIPVIGVGTLEATVSPWSDIQPVTGVIRAGRSRYVWAESTLIEQFQTGTIADLVAGLARSPAGLVVGELDAHDEEIAREHGIVVPSTLVRARRALAVADLGYRRWVSGTLSDIAALEPVYVHGPARQA